MASALRTDRLRLREFRDDDLDVLAAMVGDDEQAAFYPRPKTRAEAAAWIRRNLGVQRLWRAARPTGPPRSPSSAEEVPDRGAPAIPEGSHQRRGARRERVSAANAPHGRSIVIAMEPTSSP